MAVAATRRAVVGTLIPPVITSRRCSSAAFTRRASEGGAKTEETPLSFSADTQNAEVRDVAVVLCSYVAYISKSHGLGKLGYICTFFEKCNA